MGKERRREKGVVLIFFPTLFFVSITAARGSIIFVLQHIPDNAPFSLGDPN